MNDAIKLIEETIKGSSLNVDGLLAFLEDKKIPVYIHKFPSVLAGCIGVALPTGIYLNANILELISPRIIYHVILHECGHYLRINKKTSQLMIDEMSKINDNDAFFEYMMTEERFAEKFAKLNYFRLNNFHDGYGIDFNSTDEVKKLYDCVYNEMISSKEDWFTYNTKILNIATE